MGKRSKKQAEAEQKPKQKPKQKRKKRRGRKLIFLLVVGGAGALVLSEDLRNKALDALFGSEEQFNYTPPAPPAGDGTQAAA